VDLSAQAVRGNLVTQYNNILQPDHHHVAGCFVHGVNLLRGTAQADFNETGKSILNITGVTFNAAASVWRASTAASTSSTTLRPTRSSPA